LTTLFFFKYYDFAAENIRTAMQAGGLVVDLPQLGLLLPVGISFYTFQAIGYTIDVYRGTTCAESDFLTFALFVSFFPQLVAGPIERSGNLLPQFNTQHHFDYEQVMKGIRMMAWGFFTKLVVADRCGLYADAVFNNVNMHNGGSLLLATLLFSFQIYGDFAGYSLIAIGAARVLGFQLMENFHRPYFACSVTEFWHRWHVSLSTWLRDYVYIPLGGCRVGRLRHYVNLLTTFLVSGAWHGADWTFICWGSLHGLLLCIEKATGIDLRVHSCQQRIWRQVLTFVIVCLAWILFRVNNMSEMCSVITALFTRLNIPDLSFAMFTEVTAAMAAIGILLLREYADEHKWRPRIVTQFPQVASTIFLVFITASILLMGVLDGEQFIYFQF
jgi:D-alanyl-lipoteichoic acid acyltransferase DltB (MBOAT superfamily)